MLYDATVFTNILFLMKEDVRKHRCISAASAAVNMKGEAALWTVNSSWLVARVDASLHGGQGHLALSILVVDCLFIDTELGC